MARKTLVVVSMIVLVLGLTCLSRIALDFNCSQLEMTSALASGQDAMTDWNVYRNDDYRFQIKYPPSFDVAKVPNTLVAPNAIVTLEPIYDPSINEAGTKTNLISFSVTVGVTDSSVVPSQKIVACRPNSLEHGLDGRGSQPICFARRYSSEGAVGNRYETSVCATDCAGKYYEITLFVHSSNPGCYSSGTIAIFNSAKITRLFQMMVSTFLPARSQKLLPL